MNWDAISAIGDMIAAIAVVVSLIYLAIQVRQNTRQISRSIKTAQLAAFERNVESGNRAREFFLLNPELFDLYRKGWKSFQGLDAGEKTRFSLMLRNVFNQAQGGYIRHLSTEHDPSGLKGLEQVIDEIIRGRGVREFLDIVHPDWRPEFRAFVDERLALLDK